ncbi:MAG: 50S ribosomal protein L18 [Methanocellales archaeon]|nr:50S ribosomal protein L18 [Methanocellales archaeon]MDD4898215.1 50S ribosomal protein L18 [Methanocellales archaeon]MDD5446680.1 50S ribosomal protein L18 [Methanocellales archaeon]
MAKFRRRKEGKTNFRQRLKLLLSQKPRVVVRKSLKHMVVQLVYPGEQGDVTQLSVISSELKKFGLNRTGNISAAYLTGLLFGLRAKKIAKEAVLDIGLQTSSPGSKIYATLKGITDAGMSIPHDPVMFPSEERIKNITEDLSFEDIKEKMLSDFTQGE